MFLRKVLSLTILVALFAPGQIAYAEPNPDNAPTVEDFFEIESNVDNYSQVEEPAENTASSVVLIVSKKVAERKEVTMNWPTGSRKISSVFGWREAPCRSCSSNHKGIDFEADLGTEIASAVEGIVTSIGYNSGFGHYVIIKHIAVIEDVEYNWETVYAHLMYNSAYDYTYIGDVVEAGETIALSGRTGVATGPHLHFELRIDGEPVNPMAYLLRYAY